MKAEDTLFRTIVDVPKWANPMQPHHHFVLLGSCFAQNMGELFQSYGLDAVCNPLGVTYNPESLWIQVQESLTPCPSPRRGEKGSLPIFLCPPSPQGGAEAVWRCWWASTLLGDTDEDRFRETMQKTFLGLGEALRNADFIFLTLGTNVCYRLRGKGMTVANCHKMPSGLFEEVALDVESCINILCNIVELLSKESPKSQVIFTVSPYRYRKYGFHGSQLAKATLLLAVDRVCRLYPKKASYFPAYELLLDELRDYRFYADDMIHPAPAAVNYIWQRMVESCMTEEMRQYLKDYEPIRKAKGHINRKL